jgi:hypothetical protein
MRLSKSRRMKWTTCSRRKRVRFNRRTWEGRNPLEDVWIDGNIILKCILKERCMSMWTVLDLRIVAGYYEQGNKSSGSVKGRKFLYQLVDYKLLKKDSAS